MTHFELAKLAAMAPEQIPDWFFDPVFKEERPKLPSWMDSIVPDEDKQEIKNWSHDAIYDLPEHLSWFQELYNDAYENMVEFDHRKEISRYFQWRVFYASEIAKAVNLTAKIPTK